MPPLPSIPAALASALLLTSRLAIASRRVLAPIAAGTLCKFGPGIVRAYPEGDRYTVVAQDDFSTRLGVCREQLEVAS